MAENKLNITIQRIHFTDHCTIGVMYLNGKYFCDTLEDVDRGLTDEMTVEEISSRKVYGNTAIPKGTYRVTLDYSNKYKKIMPHILNVKGFEGIRIHSGNTDADSLGCILVGKDDDSHHRIINSRENRDKLYSIMEKYDKIECIIY